MKSISSQLATHLGLDSTTVCMLWKVTRKDDTIMGFTDHDTDIVFRGVTYVANTGILPTATANNSDLSVDNLEVTAFLDSDSISDTDIRAGLYDFADVEIRLVNFMDLTQNELKLRKGTLGQIKMVNGMFTAELRGLTQRLSTAIGQTYGPACRADLGDTRCAVNIAALRQTTSVNSVINSHTFTVDSSVLTDVVNAMKSLHNPLNPSTPFLVGPVTADFWKSGTADGIFSRTDGNNPTFTCKVNSLMFNTHPKSILPGDPHDSGDEQVPFMNEHISATGTYLADIPMVQGQVDTSVIGTFLGIPIMGINSTFQAGKAVGPDPENDLRRFDMILTGNFIVATSGNYTFKFYADDGFVGGIDGASVHSTPGDVAGGGTVTAKYGYPILMALNTPQSYGTSSGHGTWSINFPSPGVYPFEFNYAQKDGVMQFSVLVNGSVIKPTTDDGGLTLDSMTSSEILNDGVVKFTSGDLNTYIYEIKGATIAGSPPELEIQTFMPMPSAPAPGDSLTIEPGCNKSTDCQAKYVNIQNFRGEPFIPGQTAVMDYGIAKATKS
jgi:hypothetical protein